MHRVLAACLAAAALAGCTTVGPDYQRPTVPLPTAWRGEQPDAADVVNTAWWDAFGDADLSELIKAAIDANKDLLIATHRVEQLDARLEISQAAAYPQVGYNANRERNQRSQEQPALLAVTKDPSYNNYAVNLTLNWELDVWGRVARANEAARAELLATQEARRAVMLKVVTSVATSYVELLARDRQLVLARQTLANRKDVFALLDLKYKGGSATLLDVTRARAAVAEVQAAIPLIERDITLTENALGSLLGRNPGPIKRRTLDSLKLPPVPQGVPSDVLNRRPDVVAAEQTLIAANAHIGLAKSQYFPTISLTAALGLGSDQLQWLTAKTARTGDLIAGLSGTLFSGGRIEGDIRNAEAVQRQMAETYLQAVQTALREVEDSLVSRSKAGEQVLALGERVQSLQDVSKLARQRFEGGQSTYLEVLDADRQVIGAQDQQAQGLRDQYSALVAVYKAMGGGWMVEQDKLRAPKQAAAPVAPPATQQTAKASEIEIRQ
jgi:multidrug efflux system outer membrane protein